MTPPRGATRGPSGGMGPAARPGPVCYREHTIVESPDASKPFLLSRECFSGRPDYGVRVRRRARPTRWNPRPIPIRLVASPPMLRTITPMSHAGRL